MLCHLLGHWILGLALGHFLGFTCGWGAVGLWMGLCLALILIGSTLASIWRRRLHALAADAEPVTEEVF